MPARDHVHEHVRNALVNDGWTITHDPLHLRWGARDMYVDLGAERFLGAEKGDRKIAIEIKSFVNPSLMDALEKALGQFIPVGQLLLSKGRIRLLVFSTEAEVIEQWTPKPPTAT